MRRATARFVLDKLWFDGEVRSLAGSFRGEGAFLSDNGLYGYRINATRQDSHDPAAVQHRSVRTCA